VSPARVSVPEVSAPLDSRHTSRSGRGGIRGISSRPKKTAISKRDDALSDARDDHEQLSAVEVTDLPCRISNLPPEVVQALRRLFGGSG
jgi:hypothetical protein